MWELPPSAREVVAAANTPSSPSALVSWQDASSSWTQVLDEATNTTYFFNTSTQVCTSYVRGGRRTGTVITAQVRCVPYRYSAYRTGTHGSYRTGRCSGYHTGTVVTVHMRWLRYRCGGYRTCTVLTVQVRCLPYSCSVCRTDTVLTVHVRCLPYST